MRQIGELQKWEHGQEESNLATFMLSNTDQRLITAYMLCHSPASQSQTSCMSNLTQFFAKMAPILQYESIQNGTIIKAPVGLLFFVIQQLTDKIQNVFNQFSHQINIFLSHTKKKYQSYR